MSEAHQPIFKRAVVALNGGPSDARIVRLVAELARPHKSEIIAVHVVEIDWTLPLDADIAGRSEEVQRVLDMAEEVAEEQKCRFEPVLLQARDVGAAHRRRGRRNAAPTCSSWACHIASVSVANSPSARPSRTSSRTHRVRVWVNRDPIPEESK